MSRNPSGMLLRSVTFRLKAMQDGRVPDTGRAAWSAVKRAARLASGRTPCGFKTFANRQTGDWTFFLEYSTDPDVVERRKMKQAAGLRSGQPARA